MPKTSKRKNKQKKTKTLNPWTSCRDFQKAFQAGGWLQLWINVPWKQKKMLDLEQTPPGSDLLFVTNLFTENSLLSQHFLLFVLHLQLCCYHSFFQLILTIACFIFIFFCKLLWILSLLHMLSLRLGIAVSSWLEMLHVATSQQL